MIRKHGANIFRSLFLSLFLAPMLAGLALAQPPTPLEALTIALWPEFDHPEVLVIYQGQVADEVPLPATLNFILPADVEAPSAVAYLDEAQGRLLNIEDYEFTEGTGGKVLSFATPSRQFQFEYYGDGMLSRDGDTRELSFSFTPGTEVASLSFELQQPTAAGDFTSDPQPTTTQSRGDGLTYALYDLGLVPTGETRALQASYTRATDELSVNTLASVNVPSPSEQPPVEVGGGGLQDYLGPILIGVGILLLTASLLYWFWSQRSVVVPEPASRGSSTQSRRPRKRKPGVSKSTPSPAEDEKLAAYCHRCGTKFREDGLFCHACGAERRAE